MAIDPSVIFGANQSQQPNFLTQAGQIAQTQNALLQAQQGRIALQNAQLGLKAKQAIGAAYAANTDPTTGRVNMAGVQSQVAADPDAAYGLQDSTSTSQSQQGQQIGNENGTLLNQHLKVGFLTGLAAPLAADPNVTKQDVQNTIQHAVNLGLTDPGTAQNMLNSIPTDTPGIHAALNKFISSALSPESQAANAYGTPGQINNGSAVVGGTIAPAAQGGGFRPNTVTPLGISPEGQAAQVGGVDDQGRPTVAPMASRLNAQGVGNLVNPPPTMPAGGALPPGAANYPWNKGGAYQTASATPPAGTQPDPNGYADPGNDPSAASGSGNPAASPTPIQPTPPGGRPVVVGMAPGQTEAMGEVARSGATDATALMRASANTSDRKALLDNMASDLQSFVSGPGTTMYRNGASVINNWFGTNIDGSDISARQGFDKYSNQLASAQSAALGAGTDAKLEASMHANPNSSLQTSTNQQILHVLQGNEDAINAKANAWRSSGLPPGQFQTWNQQFNQAFDPRVFQMLHMTPEERQNLQSEMQKSGTLKDFIAKTNTMASQGLIPGVGAAAQPAAGGQ